MTNWKEELQRNMEGHKMTSIQMSAIEWLVNKILAEQKKEILDDVEKGLENYANKMIEDKNFNRVWFKAHIHLGIESIKGIDLSTNK